MERESMEVDVLIIGAGPAGLSAAIRLMQMAEAAGTELAVCVLEKGSEVGAHILSGAVMEPIGLDELIPDWAERRAPLNTPVTKEKFMFLTEVNSIPLPNFMLPKAAHNHGNYIVSLGNVARWMAEQAEAIEIGPGRGQGFVEDGQDLGWVGGGSRGPVLFRRACRPDCGDHVRPQLLSVLPGAVRWARICGDSDWRDGGDAATFVLFMALTSG